MKAQGLTLMHGYEYLEAPGTRITLYLMLSLPAFRSIELAFVSLHSQVDGWLNCVTLSCFPSEDAPCLVALARIAAGCGGALCSGNGMLSSMPHRWTGLPFVPW